MRNNIAVSVIGASGYVGGELLRLLLFHPNTTVRQATSESRAGRPVSRIHPNLRQVTDLRFCRIEDLEPCDVVFLCLPHGQVAGRIDAMRSLAEEIIDLSADFRLREPHDYTRWYGATHPNPELLQDFIYGIPELHRQEIKSGRFVSSAGCNATAVILALHPLYAKGLAVSGRTVVEVKAGTSQGGASHSPASHHPERSGSIRTYQPTGHRHVAEIRQELGISQEDDFFFTATSIDMVRGVQCVAHVFLEDELSDREIWKIYRAAYADEPFIRLVKERSGFHRLPDPRLLAGSNFCDIGFEFDRGSRRLVVVSAIDNLMKGAAGQAIQSLNIMNGFAERSGLDFPGIYPS